MTRLDLESSPKTLHNKAGVRRGYCQHQYKNIVRILYTDEISAHPVRLEISAKMKNV